jgi:hypothetical protein
MSSTPEATEAVPSPAASLVQIRKGTHYIWEAEKHKLFMKWWQETKYGKTHPERGNPRWDSDKRQSKFWRAFDQCANAMSGSPNILCLTCHRLFVHPNVHNSGNSAPMRHLKTCLGPELGTKRGSQPSVLDVVAKVRKCPSTLVSLLMIKSVQNSQSPHHIT